MKKNKAFICLNKKLGNDIAKEFAIKLNVKHVDLDEKINFEVLKNQVPLFEGNRMLSYIEQTILNEIDSFENYVFSLSPDLILANNNKKYFKNVDLYYLAVSNDYFQKDCAVSKQHDKEINDFLCESLDNIVIDVDQKDFGSIISEILN